MPDLFTFTPRRTPWWVWALRLLTAPIVLPFFAMAAVIAAPFLLVHAIAVIWDLED